ncbi:hypothetical protein BTHI11S_03255 [Bosea thiooxidans]
MHPDDAAARGIADGDIIRLSNQRGACLAAVRLTDGIRRGVVQLPTGAWYDPADPQDDKPLCVHGNPNVLTRDVGTSALAQGCTGQLTTVQVERFDGNLPPIQAFEPPGAPGHVPRPPNSAAVALERRRIPRENRRPSACLPRDRMPSSYIDTYYRRTLASARALHHRRAPDRRDLHRRWRARRADRGAGAGARRAFRAAAGGRAGRRWGTSGRNGGFVSPGYATSLSAIERRAGREQAEELYRLTMEGVGIVRRNIESLGIADAAPSPGIMRVLRYDGGVALQEERDAQEKRFGRKLRYLGHDETQALLRSPKYHAALADDDAFHFHPLNYARGLAREIQRLGGTIHEGSPVLSCELEGPVKRLRTAQASIEAEQVLFTTGGYTGGLFAPLKRSFLPIATYVLLTEAAPELIGQAIRTSAGIGDDRRAGDYYRLVEGGSRILWGGRITTRTSEPRDVAALLRREMVTTYPQLAPLKVELAGRG